MKLVSIYTATKSLIFMGTKQIITWVILTLTFMTDNLFTKTSLRRAKIILIYWSLQL